MAHSKLYRSFIILQEDERGHSVSKDKPLSGYAKIEVKGNKCKVAFYAQNLKKEYGSCHMMLICNKKDTKTLIGLGAMNITEQGKVEKSLEHDADNIGGTGIGYDKIVGAAICKEIGGKMVYLMCGFLNGEQPTNNWKDYKCVDCEKSYKKEEKKSYVKDYEEEHDDNHKDCDEDKDPENFDHHDKYHKEDEEECSDDNNKDDNYDYYDEQDDDSCGCDERPNKFDEYEESIEVENLERSHEDKYENKLEIKGAMGEFFMNIVDGLEEVEMTDDIKNTKWYKVPVKCFEDMCNICHYNKYTTLYYPMMNYYPYIIQKGHFMVGLKCNEKGKIKYLVYGIHGCKDKMSQPYSGKTGFVTFVPDSDGSNTGCWLMFYDFRNSMVVVPMK